MYAQVTANEVTTIGNLPTSARRLDTQEWVMGLATAPDTLVQACGYYPVTDVPKPADTATDTFDRSVQLVNGTPTVTWTQRPMTADELAAATATKNRATIQNQATTALANNRTYLAIATPTTAQMRAQIDALTRQHQGMIRLLLGQLDGTN